ncbi:MAG: poly(A) polymerase [Thermodesulfobacteriota bacterium]
MESAPLIVPRSEHSISRKDIDREALKVLYRLRDEGFSAYLVGGAVRDLYLGKKPKDFDISTSAHPNQVRKIFRNSRIIGKRFRLVQVFFGGGKIVEVSTLRSQSEFDDREEDEVLAHNNTFGTEEEDAFRRDLTINALFYEIENFTIIDYTGGVADLNDRIVRIVGDPDRRIVRDPVRMMRAVRHAARSGFSIEENSWQAIIRNLESLRLCPDSRVRDELFKDLFGTASRPWAELARACGLFFLLLPFYEGIIPGPGEPENEAGRLLLALLGVLDRLQAEGNPLPEPLVLATLLLPWAQAACPALAHPPKGHEAFLLSRELRDQLDALLHHLNIKRASREAIVTLLVNLPVFRQHGATGNYPAWFKRKSYFSAGRLFHQICQEAEGGAAAELAQAPSGPLTVAEAEDDEGEERRSRGRKRAPRRGSRAPAFSSGKGGIFGLK